MPRPLRSARVTAIVALLAVAACGGPANQASPTSATTAPLASATTGPLASASAAATGSVAATSPAVPDLSSLAGTWTASIEGAQLNHATGSYAGGVIAVNGAKINLKATHANGGFSSVNAAGRVGPTTISACSATSCEVPMTDAFPSLIKVLGDGTVALVGMVDSRQFNAGAGTCDAPEVPGAGVVTIAADGNTIRVLVGTAGGEGSGSGSDPCAGGTYQIIWTEVLVRVP